MKNFLATITMWALIVSGTAVADQINTPENPLLDQALKLEVNAAGLNEIAAYIRATALTDIDNQELPDVEDKVDGVEVKVTGLHLWANFGDMALNAETGQLSATQQILRVRMHADSIRLRKRVLGNWVSTTCQDTDITVGNSEAVPLRLVMAAGVSNRKIVISEKQTDFDIPENQFDVDGPRRCSGALGVGSLIRLVAQSVLKNSRGKIEDAVEKRIRDLIPSFADNINRAVNKRFEINLNQAPLPTTKAVAVTFPYAVAVTPGIVAVTVGTELYNAALDNVAGEKAKDQESPDQVDIGAAGINPTIITEAFKTVFPRGTPWTELNAGNTPGLSDALDVSSAAGIWPDLNEIPLTHRKLRLSIRLASAPLIAIAAQNNYIGVDIPALEMMFMAQINGQWVNYFKMQLGLRSGLAVSRNGQRLVIHMAGPKTLTISGDWAPGYTPTIPLFEQDVAELIFKSIIDFLYDSGPLTMVDIPVFAVGNGSVTAGNVALRSPFINIRLMKQ